MNFCTKILQFSTRDPKHHCWKPMDQKGPSCHAQRLMRHRHITATSTLVEQRAAKASATAPWPSNRVFIHLNKDNAFVPGPEAKGAKGSAPAEDADPQLWCLEVDLMPKSLDFQRFMNQIYYLYIVNRVYKPNLIGFINQRLIQFMFPFAIPFLIPLNTIISSLLWNYYPMYYPIWERYPC